MSIFRPLLSSLTLAAAALLLCADVNAKRIYQYRDKDGVLHFTDRAPNSEVEASEVKQTLIRAEEQDIVQMFTNRSGNEHTMTFVNKIAG
ncbi:MAG: DUF4124 domain-containing protein, partial [Xanthomonadales bacterium]|nr:DUF4124 domain-containing protein [Xanthomonadales bacterium]